MDTKTNTNANQNETNEHTPLLPCIWCGTMTRGKDIRILKQIGKSFKEHFDKYMKLKDELGDDWVNSTDCVVAFKMAKFFNEQIDKEDERFNNQRCSFCGEKLLGQDKELRISDEDFIEVCQQHWQSFKEFMSHENVDLPEDIFFKITFDIGGGMCTYDEEKQMFCVTISGAERLYKHNIAPLLWHEFFHIVDVYDPKTGKQIENRNRHYWLHEFNASAVQMKKLLSYEFYDSEKAISLFDKVIWDNEIRTVVEYFEFMIEYRINRVNRISEKIKKNEIRYDAVFDVSRSIMYGEDGSDDCRAASRTNARSSDASGGDAD